MSQKKRKSADIFGAEEMAGLQANDEEFTLETRDALPAHLLIKIESFSLLSKQGIEKYESGEFMAGGFKWRLIIHPNGLIKSDNGHISAYLAIVKTSSMPMNWEVNAFFSIFLYNQVIDKYLCFQGRMRRFHPMKSQWGFSKLISKESFRAPGNGFLVDDNCVFGAEVSVVNKSERFTEYVSVREIGYPCVREWKISSFFKSGIVLYSEEFTAGDHKWSIHLYPNGSSNEEGRSVSMYLNLVGATSFASHKRVKADFHLRIKNQLNGQHKSRYTSHWFTSPPYAWGWPAFIPLSDMRNSNKGFLVKDCCIVEVGISVKAVVS